MTVHDSCVDSNVYFATNKTDLALPIDFICKFTTNDYKKLVMKIPTIFLTNSASFLIEFSYSSV